jgi:hypothetical protein
MYRWDLVNQAIDRAEERCLWYHLWEIAVGIREIGGDIVERKEEDE